MAAWACPVQPRRSASWIAVRARRAASAKRPSRAQAMGSEYGGVLFVNCGSVGKPKDGDPRAAFAILRPGDRQPEIAIERVAYDVEAVAREVAQAGLPQEYAEKLVVGA